MYNIFSYFEQANFIFFSMEATEDAYDQGRRQAESSRGCGPPLNFLKF